MVCDHCRGRGFVEARDLSVDACRSCAARAEAEWRLRRPISRRPALRLVHEKEKAA